MLLFLKHKTFVLPFDEAQAEHKTEHNSKVVAVENDRLIDPSRVAMMYGMALLAKPIYPTAAPHSDLTVIRFYFFSLLFCKIGVSICTQNSKQPSEAEAFL